MTLAGPGRTYAWRRTDAGLGHSFARVAQDGDGWRFDATEILVLRGRPMRTEFAVRVDGAWQTASAEVGVLTARACRRSLAVDSARCWWVDGRRATRLDGCIDVDVAATPLTNTFPIRRYADLEVGRARTAPVAWIEVPSLRVRRVDQTYRRLADDAWEYSDARHGSFRLTVDADGIVVDYEGFATRVGR